jgi:Tfp pilus assembly protein FimV
MSEIDLARVRKAVESYDRHTDAEIIPDQAAFGRSYTGAAHTLARHVPALLARIAELQKLTATCSCGTSPMTYEGPEPDCPVHGAVRALNEATARIAELEAERRRDDHEWEQLSHELDRAEAGIEAAERRGYERAVARLREWAAECDTARKPISAHHYRDTADELEVGTRRDDDD